MVDGDVICAGFWTRHLHRRTTRRKVRSVARRASIEGMHSTTRRHEGQGPDAQGPDEKQRQRLQCWGFMVGSLLFAVGSGLAMFTPATAFATNMLCFVGSWFFTAAGFMQWRLSAPGAERYAAVTQSIGTVLFNLSTLAALVVQRAFGEDVFVWTPDAGGSIAFLVSAAFVYRAVYSGAPGRASTPRNGQRAMVGAGAANAPRSAIVEAHINMLGCLAFAASAVGAFVRAGGVELDPALANGGTFLGAVCFFAAALIALLELPWNRRATEGRAHDRGDIDH